MFNHISICFVNTAGKSTVRRQIVCHRKHTLTTLSSFQFYHWGLGYKCVLCPADPHSVVGWQCVRTSTALSSIHGQDPYSVPKVSSVEHSGLRSQRIVTCQQPIQMNRLRVALC